MKKEIIVILHNIRSAYNVGSIFRTADGCGVSKIYLTGYTPEPLNKFGLWRRDIAKVALGAEKSVNWEYSKDIFRVLEKLKKKDIQIISVEQDPKAIDYRKIKKGNKRAFILGNEVNGLSRSILDKSDKVIEIKMKGKKESLNVSVVAGIVLFNN